MRTVFATLIVTIFASVAVATAYPNARSSAEREHISNIWATVNICDTPAHPDVIGIRGNMPALSIFSTLYMRFQVQYLNRADGKWHHVTEHADSEWIKVGKGKEKIFASGWNFTFKHPTSGTVQTLRGYVSFEWRQGKYVVRREKHATSGKRGNTVGADPAGYSAALCEIR